MKARSLQPVIQLPQAMTFGCYCTVIRRLRADDADRLIAFFESHTEETVRRRYCYLLGHISPARATELVSVDQSNDTALGVFEMEGPSPRLIAIGRYCLAEDHESAEVAFVVHEAYRNLGIATRLLETLTAIAWERGLVALTAQVQRDNYPMLTIFRRAGATVREIPGSGAAEVTIPVMRGPPAIRAGAIHRMTPPAGAVLPAPQIPRYRWDT